MQIVLLSVRTNGQNWLIVLQRGTHCLGIFSTFRRLKMSTRNFPSLKVTFKSLEILSKVRTQINPNRINLKLQHELSSRDPTPLNIAMINQWFKNNRREFDVALKLVNESWSLLQTQ
jgi:hypothetical protein